MGRSMGSIIFLNGKFVTEKEAKISVLDPGFLYGLGLFETMRSYKNKILYLDAHLKRLQASCELIKIKLPYSSLKLKDIIRETVKINKFKDAYVRLTLWKSNPQTGILVLVKKYHPYPISKYKNGFSAGFSKFRQDENSLYSRLKTSNRLIYQLSLEEAGRKGFDEAVILNHRGYIAEGSRTNIFLVKDNAIFTPAIECGCLNGITRQVIFGLAKKNQIKVYTGNFTLTDLYSADEAFLTNSLMGIMPLVSLEKKKIGKGKCIRITKLLSKRYNCLLR